MKQRTKRDNHLSKARTRRRKKQNRAGMICISSIVSMLLIVLSLQIIDLHKKNQQYIKKEYQLEKQKKQEEARSQKILEKKEYMQTDEYVEEIAHNRFNLTYPNNILFKEKE